MTWPFSIQAAQQRPLVVAGLAFFLYGILAATAVQFIILPYILPGLHAGHGLLTGGDFPGLHEIASRKAAEIIDQGWGAWELQPEGQSSAGVASAIYALTNHFEPWSLIVFNAALHAAGGLILMQLIRHLGVRTQIAFYSGAFYVFYPSSLQWVSQIQKDSTYFAGMLAVLLGMIMLIRMPSRAKQPFSLMRAGGVIALGLILISLARLYGLELLKYVSLLLILIATPFLVKKWLEENISATRLITVMLIFLAIPIFCKYAPRDERIPADISFANKKPPVAFSLSSNRKGHGGKKSGTPEDDRQLLEKSVLESEDYKNVYIVSLIWERTAFLPESIDTVALRIAKARYGWRGTSYQPAGSMIDWDVKFWNAAEEIAYLPRAIQIGMLAPFPEHWLAQGSSPGGTVMRRVTGIEMLLLYPMLLIGLPLAAWRWRCRLEFWMIVAFCLPLLILYAYTVPNLGSLYRLRYGFLMALSAIGFAALWLSIQDWLNYKHRIAQS